MEGSSPFYDHEQFSRREIPQRGSVWIVQVLSMRTSIASRWGIPQRGSVWIIQVLSIATPTTLFTPNALEENTAVEGRDLKDPHAAALWDFQPAGNARDIRKDLKDPHAAAVWDWRTSGVGGRGIRRT